MHCRCCQLATIQYFIEVVYNVKYLCILVLSNESGNANGKDNWSSVLTLAAQAPRPRSEYVVLVELRDLEVCPSGHSFVI